MDGHHEVEAQRRAGRPTVQAIVVELSDDDAFDLAWARNRRNSKALALKDRLGHAKRLGQRQPPIPKGDIARICGLSRSTLWRLQNDVSRKQPASASPIVAYLRRIALDPTGWDSVEEAAREVRAVLSNEDLNDFAQRLGDSALAALAVAEELGFSW